MSIPSPITKDQAKALGMKPVTNTLDIYQRKVRQDFEAAVAALQAPAADGSFPEFAVVSLGATKRQIWRKVPRGAIRSGRCSPEETRLTTAGNRVTAGVRGPVFQNGEVF